MVDIVIPTAQPIDILSSVTDEGAIEHENSGSSVAKLVSASSVTSAVPVATQPLGQPSAASAGSLNMPTPVPDFSHFMAQIMGAISRASASTNAKLEQNHEMFTSRQEEALAEITERTKAGLSNISKKLDETNDKFDAARASIRSEITE